MIILVELVNLKYKFFLSIWVFVFVFVFVLKERQRHNIINLFIFFITILFLLMKNMHWPDIDPILKSNKKKGHIFYKFFKIIWFFFKIFFYMNLIDSSI